MKMRQIKHMSNGGELWGQGKVCVWEEQQSKWAKAGKDLGCSSTRRKAWSQPSEEQGT